MAIGAPLRKKYKACITCGHPISIRAQHNWAKCCDLCLAKSVVSRLKEALAKDWSCERDRLALKAAELDAEYKYLDSNYKELKGQLEGSVWKRLFGVAQRDVHLKKLESERYWAEIEFNTCMRSLHQIYAYIQEQRSIPKKIEEAEERVALIEEHRRMVESETAKYNASTVQQSKDNEYGRDKFRIREKDYKRGNRLDNYFRNVISGKVIEAFEGKCVRCGNTHDLTLDHFAIPKNEGGNFVLCEREGGAVKLNIIVLCRSCNSAKGEKVYNRFFKGNDITKALVHQSTLLNAILNDDVAKTIIRKWYDVRVPR